jgi:hypothetical protein
MFLMLDVVRTAHPSGRAVRHPRRRPSCVRNRSPRPATVLWFWTLKRSICGLLGLPLTRADGREKRNLINGLEGDRGLIQVPCSQSTQQRKRLIVEQTISSMLAGNTGVPGVGTAIRARLVMPMGTICFRPTDVSTGDKPYIH